MLRTFKLFAPALAVMGLLFAAAPAVKAADGGTVTGTVTGKDGKPAADVAVRIVKPREGGAPKAAPKADAPEKKPGAGDRPAPVAEGKTDADGKFTIDNVPAGDYSVIAGGRDKGFARGKVTVKAGEKATVTLTLEDRKAGGGGKKPEAKLAK